jgi:hypothetical protein
VLFFVILAWFAAFRTYCLCCGFLLYKIIFLSFSLAFGPLAILHGVLDLNFKLCAFCCQWTHQGEIEKLSGQYLGLICDESLTSWGLNSNPGHFDGSTILSCSCGESCLFVSWCAGGRCGITGSDGDHGRCRRPGAEDQE